MVSRWRGELLVSAATRKYRLQQRSVSVRSGAIAACCRRTGTRRPDALQTDGYGDMGAYQYVG